jgi:hypothetical protein
MTRVMSQSLDGKLSLRERLTLRLHLQVCLRCMRYLRQIVMLRKVARHLPAPAAEDSALSPEALERIRAALERKSP